MTNINRRTAIRGAGAAFAAAGLSVASIPQTPASEHGSAPETLSELMAEYREAHIASRNAEKAWRDADDAKNKAIRDADIWVPYTGFGFSWAQVGSNYRCVEISTAQRQFETDLQEAMADAADAKERARTRRRYAVLRRKLDAGAQRVSDIRIESGLEAAIDHDLDARRRSYASRDALMAYRPTTLAEVAAITKCLYQTAVETESFYSYPAAQVAIMLNPDLQVAA